ncbi:MAG: undecaprenyl-phosphate glucose phosphotransferase [Anaerolineae bacterium]|nr:undecaprenyl-phosphate glucose phosphotransferase [Anaerolineae bacterium]
MIPRLKSLERVTLALTDLLMLVGAFVLGYAARRELPLFAAPVDPPTLEFYTPILVIQTVTLLLIFFFARLYHQRRAASRIDVSYAVAASVSVGVVMTNGLTTILLKGTGVGADYPRQMILYVWLFSVLAVIVGRELHHQVWAWLRHRGLARDRALIVGSGDVAQSILQHIRSNPQLGYRIEGVINGKPGDEVGGVPVIGQAKDLPALIDQRQVDEVIIALPEASRQELVQLVALCQRGKVSIKIYPDLFSYMAGSMSVDDLGGMPLLNVRDVALRGWKLSLKRALDLVGAAFGLVVLSPFLLALAVWIRLQSPGPVFFCQERMGLDGRPFPMIKFRSMRTDAEKDGPGWTTEGDPRVTPIGRWMRKTNIDELPNLINVLLGHMSLVGPRPEQTHFVRQFREKIPRYMERHREKAGMTGWAQVNGLRGDTSIEERIKFDLWYVEHWSFWLDIKIILRTAFQTLTGRNQNAY